MNQSAQFSREVARRVYLSSIAGSVLWTLAVAGPRLKMRLWKVVLLGYTINPVAEYAGYLTKQ
jgi:hypothetical protein